MPAVLSRKLSLGVLLFSALCHLAAFLVVVLDASAFALRFQPEFALSLLFSLAAEVAAFSSRGVYRFRLVQAIRTFILIVVFELLEGKSIPIVLLLSWPFLVESVLFDSEPMAVTFDAGSIAVWTALLIHRAAASGVPAAIRTGTLVLLPEVAVTVFALLLVRYRETIVEHQQQIDSLHATVVNLSDANRAFQTYADNMESETAEKERAHITRELHDTVGYALTNVIVMMNAGKVLLRENAPALDEVFEKVRAQSEDALNETRRILYKLRAVRRFQPKGVRAISHLIRSFQGATGVEIEFNPGNMPWSLGQGLDLVMFRVIQEGLTNAFRHGKATSVRINLWKARDEIRIAVWDNGRGVAHDAVGKEGIGIAGMRERLGELGGKITANNVPGGFVLEATFPYHAEEMGEPD